ncbi:MAG: hypothetical protein Q8N88_01095 [Nanoarchaeota archaeon]|nr:hypothetical protein [Nanoarchaeota archaeon]
MQDKHKWAYIIIIIIVLILAGAVYLLNLKKAYVPPIEVLTPESYPAGTTVSLYDQAPSVFPKEVIFENKVLDYAGTVTKLDGKTQTSVSYVSDQIMQTIVDIYVGALPNVGWTITEKTIYEKVSIIQATKGNESILISIAPLKEGETKVTFQYESR